MTCHPAPLPRPEPPPPTAINAFLDLADRQINAPRQARRRARKTSRRARLPSESSCAAWRRWHGERRGALLAGPHGDAARHLIGFLDGMTLDQGAALVEPGQAGPWRHADATRVSKCWR